ncbi:MAG: PQQ-dependent sugar dehydrogenase [Gemmatimonadota bacterium]
MTFPFPALSLLALSVIAASACSSDSSGPPGPLTLTMAPVDSGFDFSVFVTAPPGDTSRLLVVERGGRILLRKNGVRQDSAFLNLTSRTSPATGEYGVYSIAFHPQFATNRRFFVYYANLSGTATLSEFTANPDLDHASPATERIVLQQAEDPTNVLYGGLAVFGPDHYLYLGLGDSVTGDQSNALPSSPAQDSSSLFGKILRIDVDHASPYSVPTDNPFVGRAGWRPEIWSLGLRNPWRFSFDGKTGELYIGDVGEHTEEEIDLAGGGGDNFGWPVTEGGRCYRPSTGCNRTGLTNPVFVYQHGSSCSLTGGFVYRGKRMPALQGTYFYGDYCGGWVRSFRLTGTTAKEEFAALASPLINDNVVSFGEDAAGEIYVVMASGRIYRIEPGQ